jgi:hypothetical protein
MIDLTKGDEVPSLSGSVDHKGYVKHLREVEAEWNKWLKLAGIPLTFDASKAISAAEESVEERTHVYKYVKGDKDGSIWPNQIRTTVDILARLLKEPGKSGVCIGPTSCGKTGTSNNCFWLGVAMWLITGKTYLLVSLLPNKVGIQRQATDEYRKFMALYGKCRLRNQRGTEMNLNRWMHDCFRSRTPIIRRSPGESLGDIKKICKRARKFKAIAGFLIDEIHWGAQKDGMQGRILKAVSKRLASLRARDIVIGFSATPWQVVGLSRFWKVGHRLSPGYVGFNFFNGHTIDPDVVCDPPNYMSCCDFAKVSGIKDFALIFRGMYRNKEQFERKKRKLGSALPASHAVYKRRTETAIAAALNWCLIQKNPCNTNGAVLRFPYCNQETRTLEENLRKYGLDPSIEVIHYTMEAVSSKVRRVIRNRRGAAENRPYVIIATGGARMADNFPPEVKYAFDFTERSGLTALIQGLLGRMCGNGKGNPVPWVILSDKAKQDVDLFVHHRGRPFRRPIGNQTKNVYGDFSAYSRMSIEVRQSDCEEYEPLKKMWKMVSSIVERDVTSDQSRLRGAWYNNFWTTILTEDVLQLLELVKSTEFVQPIKILRPGELDAKGFGWADFDACSTYRGNAKMCKRPLPTSITPIYREWNGYGKLGFRNAESLGSTNSNLHLRSDRFVADNNDRGNPMVMEIQVHVDPPTSKKDVCKLVAIKLRLKQPEIMATSPVSGESILPTDHTFYGQFRTPEEDALVGPAAD